MRVVDGRGGEDEWGGRGEVEGQKEQLRVPRNVQHHV